MEKGSVGELRRQSAYKDCHAPVIVKHKQPDGSWKYYKAASCWPDTGAAPRGEGFYIELGEELPHGPQR